jgi:hypothetical protein
MLATGEDDTWQVSVFPLVTFFTPRTGPLTHCEAPTGVIISNLGLSDSTEGDISLLKLFSTAPSAFL